MPHADDRYNTIALPAQGAYKEKGSKFLAYAYPVHTEDEVKEHVQKLKKDYFDARHHCYAYRIGGKGEQFRANDDGEPSGTAGRPILGQLLSHELTNILIVVVRYFGGIKLGTSGLIYAYKTAAADAIENSDIIERTIDEQLTITFDYAVMNDVMRIIKEEQPDIQNQQLDMACLMSLTIRKSKVDRLKERLEKVDGLEIIDENIL